MPLMLLQPSMSPKAWSPKLRNIYKSRHKTKKRCQSTVFLRPILVKWTLGYCGKIQYGV